MLSLLKKESINVPVGLCILLVLFLIFPFVRDVIYNEIVLASFEKQVKQYSHPPDSKLTQRISLVGNFARASNQCGFITAEVRTTMLESSNLHAFYAPILANQSDVNPPYHEVSLFILKDEREVENIERFYPEMYEQILPRVLNDTNAYLLMAAKTGYPPNFDLRCH